MEGKGGLILQGCGGELQEWLDGINEMFTEAGILKNGAKFQDIFAFEYNDSPCLLYPFEGVDLEIGKLAMWRLQTHETFGGTWLSDFVPNRLDGFIGEPAPEPEQRPSLRQQLKETKTAEPSARLKPEKQQER